MDAEYEQYLNRRVREDFVAFALASIVHEPMHTIRVDTEVDGSGEWYGVRFEQMPTDPETCANILAQVEAFGFPCQPSAEIVPDGQMADWHLVTGFNR